jgi:DNA polymerase IV
MVDWLFLDLNAYFASVEQQENPTLRGIPIAVLPVMSETTCCIATSYEAKAFGIQTGTKVREARARCPKIRFVEARQDLYVAYHQKILKAVDQHLPIDQVLSIDEMICRLTGTQRNPQRAVQLSAELRRAISKDVGPMLRCSIGLAPNRFLAKVASDLQKPDGLTVLERADLPDRLYDLNVRELPGIGEQMEARLHEGGIATVRQLCGLTIDEMRRLWGGVSGERLWHWLRGEETPLPPSHRHSIGHSHVLPPELRTREGAHRIAKRLISKAAVRIRNEHFWTTGMRLVVGFTDQEAWEAKGRFPETQETPRLLKVLEELWTGLPAKEPMSVSVAYHPLVPENRHVPSLFENPKREKLAGVMDQLNEKYGRDTIYFAALQDSLREAPTRIAFARIPELREF